MLKSLHGMLSLVHPPLLPRAFMMQAVASKWGRATGRISDGLCLSLPFLAPRTFSMVRAQKHEEDAAISGAGVADKGAPTIFDKIIKKEIPSDVVYEDEDVLAFRDINPQAPVHVVLIPKIRDGLTQLSKAEPKHEKILGHLLYATRVIAQQEGIEDGYRVVINNGPTACQSVYHLHLHIIGGRQLKWPPG